MGTKPVKVRLPEWEAEPDESQKLLDDYNNASHAAKTFAEARFYQGDLFEEVEVLVRMDDGTLRSFTVEAEERVGFSAFENKSLTKGL